MLIFWNTNIFTPGYQTDSKEEPKIKTFILQFGECDVMWCDVYLTH